MKTRTVSRLFHLSMWWRILYGAVRATLGFFLLKVIYLPFSEVYFRLMNYELSEAESARIIQFIEDFLLAHPFTVTGFIAAYLLFWGIVDILLSICLLHERWWAFPISLLLIGAFIIYEFYRFFHTHSLILLSVIIIDSFTFWIIWREHKELQRQSRKHQLIKKAIVTSEAI